MKTRKALSFLLPIFLAALSTHAANVTWDGGGADSNWLTGLNWDTNAAPSAGDALIFSGATRLAPANNFTANTQFNGITFSGSSSFTLSGSAINLAGNITNSSSNNQSITLALALQQNVIIDTGSVGSTTANGTTLGGSISGAFTLEKTGSGRLSLSVGNSFSGGLRISNGTLHTNNGTGFGTGTVTLGSAGGSENVMLAIQSVNSSNNLVIAAGTGTRTIQAQGGNPNFTGSVSLMHDLIVDTIGNNAMSFNTGRITGTNSIIIRQSVGTTGTVSIGGASSRVSFTGDVVVESGAKLNAGNSPTVLDLAGAGVTVNSGGTFLFNNGATIGGLDGVAGGVADMGGSSGRVLTLGGAGTYGFAGNITNTGSADGSLTARLNYGAEKGTQTLAGTNSYRGGTTLQAGKLILDYTANTGKLSDTTALTLRGGTLELKNGSYTEDVLSTTIVSAGQVNITQNGGSSKINLGVLTWSTTGDFGGSGALNIGTDGIASTSTALTNDLVGDRARFTVGGANWATKSGSDIVAYTGYTDFVGTGGNLNVNYRLTGSGTATTNQTFNSLKIASSTGSAQTLALGNQTLGFTSKGLLLTGSDDYTISTSGTGLLSGDILLHNYSSGTLTLGRTNGPLEHAGTGKTLLTTASTATTGNNRTALYMDSGTLQFSNNNQISGNGNLTLNGGTLIADTTGGNIALTNTSAGGYRVIGLGTDVPGIDVIGGGTLTLGGVISSSNSFVTPLVFGSASSNGTISLTGTNTYIGDTRLDGARLSVNSNASLGSTDAAYKVIFSRNSTLNTTANISTSRYYEINGGVTGTIETDASTTLTNSGTIVGAGNLRKAGAGTLTLSGTNTYTGGTTISVGTLILDAAGTIANSSGVNLGTAGSAGTLDLTAKSAFRFGTGQTVSGYGTINIGTGKTVTVAGILTPGNSPGLTSVIGGLALESSTATTMELASLGGVAGTDFDSISASEMLTYAGSLSIVSYGGFNINQTGSYGLFDFASYAGNFDSVSVGGFGLTFDTVKTWAGTSGGNSYTFTLDTGVLSIAVPEPSTWALLAFSLTTITVMRRRRR